MLNALTFGTDRRLTSELQQMCALTQDISVFRSLEHYPQAHETMRLLNSFSPHLVFLGTGDEGAAATVEQDIRSILPTAAILGVSGGPGSAGIFETGAGGFPTLVFPCASEE